MDQKERTVNWPRVWCTNCKKIQPLLADYLPKDQLNEHDAMDLVCEECKFIVATLHDGARTASR